MTARNTLTTTPPYAVEQSLKRLGADLRTARLRRNLTHQAVAEKIGAGVRAVADAERGKPSTGIAVYVALLWAFNLLEQLDQVARPENDATGLQLALAQDRKVARAREGLSNDF